MTDIKWVYRHDAPLGHPEKSGWYAIELCWDAEEGVFPTFDHFSGTIWREYSYANALMSWSSEPFTTPEEAQTWARANDRDG